MYEFEKNKANNLILYGINTKHPETSDSLKNRISNVFRDHLNIRREITIQKASRVHTGKLDTNLIEQVCNKIISSFKT